MTSKESKYTTAENFIKYLLYKILGLVWFGFFV